MSRERRASAIRVIQQIEAGGETRAGLDELRAVLGPRHDDLYQQLVKLVESGNVQRARKLLDGVQPASRGKRLLLGAAVGLFTALMMAGPGMAAIPTSAGLAEGVVCGDAEHIEHSTSTGMRRDSSGHESQATFFNFRCVGPGGASDPVGLAVFGVLFGFYALPLAGLGLGVAFLLNRRL